MSGASPTFVNLSKQTTLGGILTPLTSVLLTAPVPKLLSDLRVKLTSSGILTSTSQQFLNAGGFPISLDTEPLVSWLDITANGANPLGVYFPATSAVSTPVPTTPLAQPTLPDPHKFDPLPTVPDIAIPTAGTVAPAPAQNGAATNARTLSEAQLAELFDINSLFSGYSLSGGDDAQYCSNVFQTPQLYKPLVRVDDAAKIDTITTFSATSAALARQGFDSASLGLGTPWASGSFSAAGSRGTGVVTKGSHAYITGVYRFSRALIQFRDKDLHPTAEFTSDFAAALQGPDDDTKRSQIRGFFAQYGHAFAHSIELGGLLHTTKETTISSETEQTQKEQDMRGALSLSVQTGTAAIVTGNAGAEHGKNATNTGQDAHDKDSLYFEATGGDTLLASDPPNWTRTVSDYHNWRVCKLSNMKLLTDIPGLFTPAQLAELKRLAPAISLPAMKASGPVKPLQGKWVQPRAIQDDQGLGSFQRFVVYAPTPEVLSGPDGGWYYLGQTTSATSTLIVRQNPAWRPIVEAPGITPPATPPVHSASMSATSSSSASTNNPLATPSLYNFSNEDAPFCPVAKYDRIWSASAAFDAKATATRHKFSLWEAFPQDPSRFVSLTSAFSGHAPVDVPPTFDPRVVCLNKKYLVKASLAATPLWTETGAFVSHEAGCFPVVVAPGAKTMSNDIACAPGTGVPVSAWKAVAGHKADDFTGDVWLLDEDYIEFLL